MSEDVVVFATEDSIHVVFYIEHDNVTRIGEQMQEICEDAYMNGYNWDAFLQCWLSEHAPELLEGLDSDPEAGMYAAYYAPDPRNREKAEALAAAIAEMLADEEEIYSFLRAHQDDIEWD